MARLSSLPRSPRVWEVSVRSLQTEDGSQIDVLLVAEEEHGPIAAEPMLDPAILGERLVELMQDPVHGHPRRPREIRCVDASGQLRRRVARAVKGSGVTISVIEAPDLTQPIFDGMLSLLAEPEVCGITVELERFRAVLQGIVRRNPWAELEDDLGVAFEGVGLDDDLLLVRVAEDQRWELLFVPAIGEGGRERIALTLAPTSADPPQWVLDAMRQRLVIQGMRAPLLVHQLPTAHGVCDEAMQRRLLLALEALVGALPEPGALVDRGWQGAEVQTPEGAVSVKLFVR